MAIRKQRLKLGESIAAVHFTEHETNADMTGVAVTIPAGEIIHVDATSPIVGRMRQIIWKGSWYGVFPDDLQARTRS